MEAYYGTKETVPCSYEIKFLQRSRKLKNGFIFPEIVDIASLSENDIVRVLPQPKAAAQTKRLSSVLNLAVDLHMCKLAFYIMLTEHLFTLALFCH